MLDAVDLRQPGHTGQAAGNGEGDDINAVRANAAQLGSVVVHAHRADPIAERGFIQQYPYSDCREDCDYKSPVDTGAGDQIRQIGIFGDAVCLQILRLGLLQAGTQQEIHKGADHICGHHTDQKFIGAEFCLDKSDEAARCAAGGKGGHQYQQDDHDRG